MRAAESVGEINGPHLICQFIIFKVTGAGNAAKHF